MRCCVCRKETPPRKRYCARCRKLIDLKHDRLKRRAALREAYDPSADGFRCHWSGALLEERDRWDPFHICFDHLVPVEASRLVASSELSNHLKGQLSPTEFPRAIKELAAHNDGEPFDRDCIGFEHWTARAPAPPGAGPRSGRVTRVIVDECVICGDTPRRWSYYCPRCYRFVIGQGRDISMHVRAMREAWDPVQRVFRCHYTGVRVDETDRGSPWFLTFDHATPGDKGTIVVAAYWINLMKNQLSEREFRAVVGEYDRFFREGGEFDRNVVGFEHWRRARQRGR